MGGHGATKRCSLTASWTTTYLRARIACFSHSRADTSGRTRLYCRLTNERKTRPGVCFSDSAVIMLRIGHKRKFQGKEAMGVTCCITEKRHHYIIKKNGTSRLCGLHGVGNAPDRSRRIEFALQNLNGWRFLVDALIDCDWLARFHLLT